ncbi:hypothetical protein [Streptomyces melanogenes]
MATEATTVSLVFQGDVVISKSITYGTDALDDEIRKCLRSDFAMEIS